jgi:hypothetical protein
MLTLESWTPSPSHVVFFFVSLLLCITLHFPYRDSYDHFFFFFSRKLLALCCAVHLSCVDQRRCVQLSSIARNVHLFFFFLGSTGSGERGAFGLRRLADRELQFIRKQEATNNKQNRRTPYGQLVLSGDQRKSIFFLLAKAPGE